jgi:hypothetical protein
VTEHGVASTVAFTNGYGAPEVVGTLEDQYDCTADIYSFGMLLYVLLNGLRFPESGNYRPNVHQYDSGYEAPLPTGGSEQFGRIVLKMISFSPDDRYQSMDEVLNELETLRYDKRSKYQREHKESSLVLGAVFAMAGVVLGKLSVFPNQQIALSVWMYFFCALCMGKGLLYVFKKPRYQISLVLLVVGTGILVSDGFAWWKLLLLLYLVLLGDVTTGLFGCGLVLVSLCSMSVWQISAGIQEFQSLRWASVLLLSMGAFLLLWYFVLWGRDGLLNIMYLKKNRYWKWVTFGYACTALFTPAIELGGKAPYNLFYRCLGETAYDFAVTCNLPLVGLLGTAFCLGWMARERVLAEIEKKREEWLLSMER